MKAPGLLSPAGCTKARACGRSAISRTIFSLMASAKSALLANRDHERPKATDDAVAKVQVEVLGFPGAGGPLQHDRQSVDGDVLGQRLVASQGHHPALVICPVPRDIDRLASGTNRISDEAAGAAERQNQSRRIWRCACHAAWQLPARRAANVSPSVGCSITVQAIMICCCEPPAHSTYMTRCGLWSLFGRPRAPLAIGMRR